MAAFVPVLQKIPASFGPCVVAVLFLLLASPAQAQMPTCTGPTDAGSSYETCNSGTCEKFVCNGTGFTAAQIWNHDGTTNIDFGNDTSPCNAQRIGRIRYTGGVLWEYCNGLAWVSLAEGIDNLPLNGDYANNGRVVGIGSNPQRNFLSYAGTRNTFLGDSAGGSMLSGTDNTFIGYHAGNTNTVGNNNIFIGSGTGGLTVGASGIILLGINLDAPTLLTSNYINIGNVISGSTQVLGSSNTGTSDNSASLAIDGSLKLGTSSELCLPGNGGRMRYNSTTKKMQYCNELTWTDM